MFGFHILMHRLPHDLSRWGCRPSGKLTTSPAWTSSSTGHSPSEVSVRPHLAVHLLRRCACLSLMYLSPSSTWHSAWIKTLEVAVRPLEENSLVRGDAERLSLVWR